MVQQYAKRYEIEIFVTGDIVTLKFPGGSGGVRTATDYRRLFCTVRKVFQAHRFELQTKYGVLDRLVPTRELKKVPRLLADSMEMEALVNGPSKRVSIIKIGEMASTSDRLLISCRCKGKCSSRQCRCFKEGKRCSVHCHANVEHDCGLLASLMNPTERALTEKEKSSQGKKRARADTTKIVLLLIARYIDIDIDFSFATGFPLLAANIWAFVGGARVLPIKGDARYTFIYCSLPAKNA